MVPTRELCQQVTNDLLTAGKVRDVRVLAIYGGRAYEPQVEALNKGVDVIVGTPGRLLDLAGQRKLDLGHVKALVLDEADEMLDLGFLPDVERIVTMLPAKRQTMLFSATMPGAVIGLARRYMTQPTHIRATSPDDEGATVANIAQHVFRAHSMDKPELVSRILQAEGRGLAMIFCRTKRTAADIAEQLQRRGFASGAVHGDLGQGAREQALRAFRNGKVDVLVCTDVAARGIDVEGVTHVINYQTPEDEKTYLHRIGRTGRAGRAGIAITLVDWDDIPRWQLINKALELTFNDPVETYSTSPHLYEELRIPEGTKGTLPRADRTRAGLAAEELEDLGETGGRGARGGRADARRGRGGRSEGREERQEERSEPGERPARQPRRRRRTRSGEALAATGAPAVTEAPATAEAPAKAAPAKAEAPARAAAPAKAKAKASAPAKAEEAVAASETAEAAARAPRRRRRTRPVAEAPAFQTVETAAAEAAAEAAAPRRRTRKAAAEAEIPAQAPAAEQAAESDEAAPAKPRRRTRKPAAAKAEQAPAEQAAGAGESAPRAPAAAPARRPPPLLRTPSNRRTRPARRPGSLPGAGPSACGGALACGHE